MAETDDDRIFVRGGVRQNCRGRPISIQYQPIDGDTQATAAGTVIEMIESITDQGPPYRGFRIDDGHPTDHVLTVLPWNGNVSREREQDGYETIGSLEEIQVD